MCSLYLALLFPQMKHCTWSVSASRQQSSGKVTAQAIAFPHTVYVQLLSAV